MSTVALLSLALGTGSLAQIEPGTHARYLALTCEPGKPAPFVAVEVTLGPPDAVAAQRAVWWQMEIRGHEETGEKPLVRVQALTSRYPVEPAGGDMVLYRYIVYYPDVQETLEYRNVHTGRALLPPWRDFTQYFIPRPTLRVGQEQGVARTCEMLGHVLTLKSVETGAAWQPLNEAKVLTLDPEMLVGTSRNFKDKEGYRLPQKPERQNYTYTPFVEADYPAMIEAGINLFIVDADQERFVRDQSVFFIRSAGGTRPLAYPADLYRSNYLGSQMFMDEPSIIMVGDERIHKTLMYFSDAAAVIEKRVRGKYNSEDNYGAFALEKEFRKRGIAFGDMRLEQCDYPTWETLYDTAYYQMAGGCMGIVHEGRYQLAEFDERVAKWTTTNRQHTPEELLRYHYAFLRGGTRPFGKYWGTAIYGQCDPAISPLAMTLAYDMGARYLWFWTSDHDHHMPWPEQLALARQLRDHVRAHPRPSIFGPPAQRDLAIVIPYGYFLSLDNLWWVRELDVEGRNESSQRYRRLMERAHGAVQQAFDQHEDFDITVDGRAPIEGYRRVLRINDEP